MNSIVKSIRSIVTSSVGRKFIVACTGVPLYLFLAGHMAGNLTTFWGPDALNAYAHHLQGLPWPFLWGFRVAMLALIAIHIVTTLKLKAENMAATPKYQYQATLKATLSSRTMVLTGVMLACFIVFHILNYTCRVGYNMADFMTVLPGMDEEVPNVFKVITDASLGFGNPLVSGIYIVAMLILASHLRHGIQSVFQTLGLSTKKLRPLWVLFANLYALVVCGGLISIPVCVLAGIIK